MTNAVNKLIAMVTKYGTSVNSEIFTNVDGEQYHFIHSKGPKNTPIWLKKAFEAAATEVTGKYYSLQFHCGNYSFAFDRNPFKGGIHGAVTMRELIVH